MGNGSPISVSIEFKRDQESLCGAGRNWAKVARSVTEMVTESHRISRESTRGWAKLGESW